MGEVAAIGSVLGGAAQLGSLFMSNNNAAETQAAIANANLQNTANQQRYQQQLNALAMQRAIAGMTDATGNRVYYDPSTNQWKTVLSERGGQIQTAAENANITRNTTDLQRQQRANIGAESRGIDAASAAQPILESIKRFKSTDPRALEGALQEGTTLAHREAFQPIIDSTLRQFTRIGANSAPVLARLGSQAATSLRQSMLENIIRSRSGAVELDNSKRGGMIRDFSGLNAQASPNLQYSPISSDTTASALLSAINNRANNAAGVAGYAGASVPGMTNAFTAASQQAIGAVPNSNLFSAQLAGLGKTLSSGALSPLLSLFNQGAGNRGDAQGTDPLYDPWNTPYIEGQWS